MFREGKWYKIEERSMTEETSGLWKVVKWEPPLLKISNRNHGPDRIINTTSPGFHAAELAADDDQKFAGISYDDITGRSIQPKE